MRWDDNFSSILKEKGYNIIWSAGNDILKDSASVVVEVEFEKDGKIERKRLRHFLSENEDESLHEFIRIHSNQCLHCYQKLYSKIKSIQKRNYDGSQ